MKKLLSLVSVIMVIAGCTEEQAASSAGSGLPTVRVQSLRPQALIILEKGLKSRNALLRTHAIEIIAETNQKDMLPMVTKLTLDNTVAVRFAATVALGDMRCFSCENIIRKSLNDPDVNVRIAGAYALSRLGKDGYADLIRAAIKSTDQTERANAALLLGKIGNTDDISLLYKVLSAEDSTDKVRIQTVESLAHLGDERMYRSKLWALQISKFADDRVMGIRGMGALNNPESRNAITTMLDDEVLEVRLAAAEQLARLGDSSGEELTWNYFQTQPDLNNNNMANRMAVMAIGSLQSKQLNSHLPNALSSKSATIQLLSARSVLLQLKK